MIELFSANTPNGIKIPIALEEIGLTYTLHKVSLGSDYIRSPEFAAINPNAKIPALQHVDRSGQTITLFESGAILSYLADTFGVLGGKTPQGRASTLSWLFLQVAGLGPAMGNSGHFLNRTGQTDRYALERFQSESLRLLRILEQRIAEASWLNSEAYSVADIAHYAWVRKVSYAGLDLKPFAALRDWVELIENRPATMRALARLQ